MGIRLTERYGVIPIFESLKILKRPMYFSFLNLFAKRTQQSRQILRFPAIAMLKRTFIKINDPHMVVIIEQNVVNIQIGMVDLCTMQLRHLLTNTMIKRLRQGFVLYTATKSRALATFSLRISA